MNENCGVITPMPAGPVAAARPSPATPAGSPLTEAHFAMIRAGAVRRKGIRKAAKVAFGSAATTLVIGVLTLPLALVSLSGTALVVGAAICAIGAVEFVGYRKLLRAERSAPKLLAMNQLAFLGVILLYCAFQMVTFSTADARNAVISPEAQKQLAALPGMQAAIYKQVDQWAPVLTYGFYSLVAFLSIGFQGGMALYYFTRQKTVESYTRGTSEWIRRLFIEMGA